MRTYSPMAATTEEMNQTLLHDSEVWRALRAMMPSLEPALHPPYDVEPESSEAESGPPFGFRVSPPSQELPSSHAHETVQDKDCDVDTEDSSSEDGLDVQEFARDQDYCPSPLKA
ncbi:hypothetical protein FOXG_15955 [Fusarium oxysporum f. sp. lycopersici 4287]|uniref:Uncharacterized protein n=2 Tax=Fusarium oxysporum TaxID=5507 RepID=A0A0J9W6U8_FUSO4|nr:hypothetical protein FOXG_15955 [Fusarium oxysporum f. sp. lycopersici 4287]EXK26493.1 hypothetical protein FOMG_16898 [Fusarium oxysporum f. sp. melonis 26406]KNB18558.1 hypothetical protein FOXG_15955 [Fusarium oxysporum f. sp. lycopersici 4287]